MFFFFLADAPKPTEASQPSDREQYRRAPEASGAGGDKKGEAGAGSFEFVCFFYFNLKSLFKLKLIFFFMQKQKGGFGRGKKPTN